VGAELTQAAQIFKKQAPVFRTHRIVIGQILHVVDGLIELVLIEFAALECGIELREMPQGVIGAVPILTFRARVALRVLDVGFNRGAQPLLSVIFFLRKDYAHTAEHKGGNKKEPHCYSSFPIEQLRFRFVLRWNRMPFVKVADTREVPANSVIEVFVGDEPIAVCNVQGEIHALGGTCPHQGGPLGQGAVNGSSVTCPWHAWDFDCRTGENDFDPARKVAVYPVRLDAGEISIEFPNA
jgi:nitrite reductase (NADH) small subunit